MRLLCPPGVYRPQADTRLLADAAADAALPARPRVLDPCTGTGALAISAAKHGARSVTAVDVSRRAVAAAWVNSRARRLPIELVHGDFRRSLRGRQFDVVLANPPYVPGGHPWTARGAARAWEAGPDGRTLLDALCAMLPAVLAPDGVALIVQSALCGEDQTLVAIRNAGLKAATVARSTVPFGPVLRARMHLLRSQQLITDDQFTEELLVIRADRSVPSDALPNL
ncbi:HemK2/MTQ2 family protein methyltransferase [Nocardia bovistercoris]|uniref:Methyltransferase n=1 Tax=Nocardia bovistercoris TaxID=2785916 RepID=A0A931I946_9NOCA|nr:HemK2/MTQ2 family protein methyltransferase [Nocardia bovistercoris]MBH0776979.1 methyltransferase [Nocardia bovistercoris]